MVGNNSQDVRVAEIVQEMERKIPTRFKQRGREYYRQGCISGVVLSDEILQAKCEGNEEYILRIYLDTGIIMSCNCPFDDHCKHLGALLQWLKHNSPHNEKTIRETLMKKSREELIDLIVTFHWSIPEIVSLHLEDTYSKEGIQEIIRGLWLPTGRWNATFQAKRECIERQILQLRDFELLKQYLSKMIAIRDHQENPESFEESVIFPFLFHYEESVGFEYFQLSELRSSFSEYDYLFQDLEWL